ncbi:MAG TPA: acetyl-CoA carboxylase carboxyl transferase subunit alpha [Clostridiales bacterium]|nr:acetyl-CoA carboxylase carboxyl transferase subunit alpha [Clostridiales bacterium]
MSDTAILNAYDRVKIARRADRPTGIFYLKHTFQNFIELHGDRNFADDHAIIGGIAWLGNKPVTVIAQERGTDTADRIYRNFGCPHPEGYRKALRLMKQAEKFKRPVICLVDTQGAYCGVGAEERGQGEAIARNIMEMMGLKTPIISVVIGEGGSGGALAMAAADSVWMMENATYSVISPEGCSSILWKDASRARDAAEALKLTAGDLFRLGLVDRVIGEDGGAHLNPEGMAIRLGEELSAELDRLCRKKEQKLLEDRYMKFRAMGQYENS